MAELALDSFHSREVCRTLAAEVARLARAHDHVKIMHVCGSHEHALRSWGLRSLLPANIELIAGPGCPVCVCPEHEIREALTLAERGAIVATYGDMLRVPTAAGSLADAAARGATVKIVYTAADAAKLALAHPDREVVFFGVGFETTAAPTAALLAAGPPPNLSVLTAHRLTPPAMVLLLRSGEIKVDALIAPGHVSVIIGAEAWRCLPEEFGLPTIVAGFDPTDLLLAVRDILVQREAGVATLGNVYGRVVKPEGNRRAQAVLDQAFEVAPVWWRGLGELPASGLRLRPSWGRADARTRFDLHLSADDGDLPKGCACNEVMLGKITPPECKLFKTACHPLRPYGPCMVSQEGTCYLWHQYGG